MQEAIKVRNVPLPVVHLKEPDKKVETMTGTDADKSTVESSPPPKPVLSTSEKPIKVDI